MMLRKKCEVCEGEGLVHFVKLGMEDYDHCEECGGDGYIVQDFKVFRINDGGVAEWVAGKTREQVVAWYEQQTGEKVHEIDEESLDIKFNIEKEDGTGYELKSLRELVEENAEELPSYCGYAQ
ncbi:hypothetical protein P9597_11170 [Aneurinibacillus migulanus]|uniref:hypothetical protein n=1 Tax=Aneurinibacillus migulanus TaxID=47500 RepID=UPI002E225E5B|nr:hypothetical protein [Aneurinibacillus migulanus]